MKVRIRPYVEYFGAYHLAEVIGKLSRYTEKEIEDLSKTFSKNWVGKLLNWVHDQREKRQKNPDVEIERFDTWNMDHTLARIIHPMLVQLKSSKMGYPVMDYSESVPPFMENKSDELKWDWVLDEMIFAFDALNKNLGEMSNFTTGDITLIEKEIQPSDIPKGHTEIDVLKSDDYYFDEIHYKLVNDRMQNGFRLFGLHYRNLWD